MWSSGKAPLPVGKRRFRWFNSGWEEPGRQTPYTFTAGFTDGARRHMEARKNITRSMMVLSCLSAEEELENFLLWFVSCFFKCSIILATFSPKNANSLASVRERESKNITTIALMSEWMHFQVKE